MNREILFRGKRVDNGEWVYGSLVENYIISFLQIDKYDKKHDLFKCDCVIHDILPNTVGQLIHIEKDGRKWFEGDIAKIDIHVPSYYSNSEWGSDYEGFDGYAIGEVTFNIRHGLCIKNYKLINEESEEVLKKGKFKTITLCRAEIIGNIHDNKDLV